MTASSVARSHILVSILFGPSDVPDVRSLLESIAPDQNLAFLLVTCSGEELGASSNGFTERLVGRTSLTLTDARAESTLAQSTITLVDRSRLGTISSDLRHAFRESAAELNGDGDVRARTEQLLRTLTLDLGRRGCVIAFASAGSSLPNETWLTEQLGDHPGLLLVQPAPGEPFRRFGAALKPLDSPLVLVSAAELPYAILEHAEPLIAERRPPQVSPLFQDTEGSLDEILQLVQRHHGHDFSSYKTATLVRRTIRRMHKARADSAPDYLERLRNDPSEATVLFHELLVGVTAFFRDPEAFESLATNVLPGLAASDESSPPRVWVAGCSTGEEAYTIAMLCEELSDRVPQLRRIQIFASDVDRSALERAREGRFPLSRAANLTPERLARFFNRNGQELQAKRWLRDRIVFARHDLLADVPFSRLDLICCRNVLIYFREREPDRLLTSFHRALRSNGKLLLGSSESVRDASLLFAPLDLEHRLYQRIEADSPVTLRVPTISGRPFAASDYDTGHALIFDGSTPSAEVLQVSEQRNASDGAAAAEHAHSAQAGAAIVERLESDLREARAELLRVSRDADSVSDELKSTIEELSAMNEEMQSAIEELDRSKGELQNVNCALADSNRELGNLLDSTGIPTIFLDVTGAIRRANPHAGRIYNLLPEDVGRSLDHFTHRAVQMPALPSLDEVQSAQHVIEHEVELQDGSTWLRRVRAYASAEDLEPGLSITFTDVTERVRFQRELRASEARLRSVINATFAFIGLMATDGTLLEANEAPLQATGLTREGTLGRKMWDCGWFAHSELAQQRLREAFARAVAGELVRYDEEICVVNDGRMTIDFMLQPVFEQGKLQFLVPSAVDVTHREVAEEQLRGQHALVRAITENASTAIFVLDAEGRCTFANPAAERMTDCASDRLAGDLLHDRLHPPQALTLHNCAGPECALALALTGDGGEVRELEAAAAMRGTGAISIAVSTAPIRSEDSAMRTVVEIRDITLTVSAQRELRSSEARFRQMAEAMPQMTWIADAQGNVFWYNQRWHDYTGSTLKDVAGWGWQRYHDPDVLPTVMERWQSSIAEGSTFDMVFPILGQNGKFRPFITRSSPLRGESGEVQLWFGTCTDISEERAQTEQLRRNERRLQSITDALPDLLMRFDRDRRHTFANAAVERVTGQTLSEMVGRTSRELGLSAQLCDQFEAALDEVFATGKQSSMQCAYGTIHGERSFEVLFSPELDAEGDVEFVLSLARDRTAELAATDALHEASRRKDEFLATLAHELRNPLAPLRNGLEILRRTAGDDGRLNATREIMERQVSSMTRLVEDLLDVSRISLGKVALRTAPVDLREVVNDALELTQYAAQKRGLFVETQVPEHAVVVQGDRTRLGQILANLLSNAVKNTPRQGQVTVSLRVADDEAFLVVSDTGKGIASDQLEQIFELFVQLPQPGATAEGLGVGLALVRQLVSLHGGTVSATSDGPGTGSTFLLRLPYGVTDQATSTPEEHAVAKGERPLRILVVDDNIDVADSLATILQLMGHSTTTAHSGAEALQAAADSSPDLVFADIGLPDMSGYELAEALRLSPNVKRAILVAVTGWGSDDHRRRSVDSGFDYHLTKPAEVEVIERIVARTLMELR